MEGKICYSHILIYRTVNKIRFFYGHIQTSINVLFLFFFLICVSTTGLYFREWLGFEIKWAHASNCCHSLQVKTLLSTNSWPHSISIILGFDLFVQLTSGFVSFKMSTRDKSTMKLQSQLKGLHLFTGHQIRPYLATRQNVLYYLH